MRSSAALIDLKGDLSQVEVICVFGVGDGAVYRQLRSWLKGQEQRFLVFFEEEEELFLKMKQSALAKDPKVRLFFYQEGSEELFKEIAWEFLFLKFGFYARPEYVEAKGEKLVEIFSKIEHYHRGIDLIGSDFQDLGVAVLRNVMGNQKHLARAALGQSLQGACNQIPAIICAAGPSLNQQIPLLASLRDRAMLFAGGSAVAALTKQGISPHFCAHFDPNPPKDRFLSQDAAEIPHFYQSRFSAALLDLVHAPLLWMADGGNYPVEKWLSERGGMVHSPLDAGWTVANFCTAAAILLGCNPIIFVGMEFSCSPDRVYAAGMDAAEHAEEFIEVQDGAGERLWTKNDWIMSSKWQGELTQKHPEVQFLNATPRGLPIPHVEKMTLEEIASRFLTKQLDLAGTVHSLLQRAERPGKQEGSAVSELLQSYAECDQICDQLLKLWEKHYPKSPLETAEYAVVEHSLQAQVCFQTVLEPLWQIWKRPILRASDHPLGNHIQRLLFFKRAIGA